MVVFMGSSTGKHSISHEGHGAVPVKFPLSQPNDCEVDVMFICSMDVKGWHHMASEQISREYRQTNHPGPWLT